MGEITETLRKIKSGEAQAADQLLALVYDELRRIAARKMAQESANNTLQPTALVHEVWLRLSGDAESRFEGRGHFFAAASEAMRRILVESARRKQSAKRGGSLERAPFEESMLVASASDDEVIAVNQALDAFAAADPEAAQLVKLRYFVGMTMPEAATAMGIPLRSAERLWTFARAWLRRQISKDQI